MKFGKQLLPRSIRRWLVRLTRWPPVGKVRFDNLRRLKPISHSWGGDRGQPIDRYYIEKFLEANSRDIQGRVLEIGDNVYTKRYGGRQTTHSDVADISAENPKATLVVDLSRAENIPDETFHCVICVQTIQFIPNMKAAAETLHRILKPGGVLLLTGSTISQLDTLWDEYWRFTSLGARWLFEELFGRSQVEVTAFGNVLTAISFLHGLAAEELTAKELAFQDPQYELVVTVRAVKPLQK